VLGLKKLGHEVLFLEDSDNYPGCSNPFTGELTTDPSHGLKFIQKVFNDFDIKDSWAYYDAHTNTWQGLKRETVFLFCNSADIVLNISAINPLRDWYAKIPNRILIDTDPVFTQIRHLTNKTDFELAGQHTAFFSFGENFGKPGCTIPNDGFNWQSTRQPVFLDAWNFGEVNTNGKWTTVMQWDSYNQQTYKNGVYGMKSKSFSKFVDLPKLLKTENFELAIGSATAPIEQLKSNGWNVISSLIPTKTANSYQHFIQQSKGEWSIAKHGYVISNSGWFSERSAAYLASGKPVIIQNTGFSDFIETGKGLHSFKNCEEAISSIEKVNSGYRTECSEARTIAEDYFNSDFVLTSLLNRIY
jgi:hypothetical protein